MSEENKANFRKQKLDDFWDIEFITPKRHTQVQHTPKRDETVEIKISSVLEDITGENVYRSEKLSGESGVIRKMISDDGDSEKPEIEYSPENSLIHKVRIFKWKSPYSYYEKFYQDALSLKDKQGEACERVGFFSYVPQYDQLSAAQLAYYLYFRSEAQRGVFLDADQSYVLLYVYEIINLGEVLDTSFAQAQLVSLWKAYGKKYPKLNKMLVEWICDYSLIHRLQPPQNVDIASIAELTTLKEFFIVQREADNISYADILLAFCTSYDFRTSKFAVGDALDIYETYIPMALGECIKLWSVGGILSNVGFNDSLLPRDAYSGALCSHRIKRKIEVEYCSFSRTNELRYLVGDIVKYSENKIRAHLGIKPRLSCYSIDSDMRKLLDEFFDNRLPRIRKVRVNEKRQEYDVLYDLPKKPLSISEASRIEEASWETTRDLVEAFDDAEKEEDTVVDSEDIFAVSGIVSDNISDNADIISALGSLAPFAIALYRGDRKAERDFVCESGRMPDSIVDAVNEISAELIGDILIEDGDDGYRIIEDYKIYFMGAEN